MTRRTLAAVLIAGLMILVLGGGTQPARPVAAQPSAQVTIRTDRPGYAIGDRVRICYQVPGPGRVTLTSLRLDDPPETVYEADDAGRGDCLDGRIIPPAGRECVRLDWRGGGRQESAETCFEVHEATAPAAGPAPATDPVARLAGEIFLDLCFQKGQATFAAEVIEATPVQFGGGTYAYVLVDLFNLGPQPATAALAVFLIDERERGGWMEEVADEADYLARAQRAGALTPFDTIPLGQTVRVLFLFRVPPGARVLALSPNPVCFI